VSALGIRSLYRDWAGYDVAGGLGGQGHVSASQVRRLVYLIRCRAFSLAACVLSFGLMVITQAQESRSWWHDSGTELLFVLFLVAYFSLSVVVGFMREKVGIPPRGGNKSRSEDTA
jgi:hypothetical protein